MRPKIFKRLLARSPNGSTKCRVFRPYTYLEAGYEAIIGPIATSTSASTLPNESSRFQMAPRTRS